MTEEESTALGPGELYVQVTYEKPNECAFYGEVKNGFRSSFWVVKGISTAIMFVDIPDGEILPGETKRIRAYTINAGISQKTLFSEKVYWGTAICAFGTIALWN